MSGVSKFLCLCPPCGCGFDQGEAGPGGCPLSSNCGRVCCPRCGYSFAPESRTVNWLKKIFPSTEKEGEEGKR